MFRITGLNFVANIFGAGKNGFRDGDLPNGIFPTYLNADWFNHIQEEVANVIEGQGVVLDNASRQQMAQALSRVTAAGDPTGADNSTKLATTGWIRSSMAAIATAAGFAISKTANGYIKFPSWLGGWIVQWGSATASVGGSAVTFPIAFPTANLALAFAQAGPNGVTYYSGAFSNVSFTFFNTSATGAHRYIAIGY